MALTITKVTNGDYVVGNKKVRTRDITFDNSYATGGMSLTAANVGLRNIVAMATDAGAKNSAGTSVVPVRYDYTNSKLQAYRYDGASAGKAFLEEVANAVDLSAFTVRAVFTGV
jgi:hypothetical protein